MANTKYPSKVGKRVWNFCYRCVFVLNSHRPAVSRCVSLVSDPGHLGQAETVDWRYLDSLTVLFPIPRTRQFSIAPLPRIAVTFPGHSETAGLLLIV